MLLLFYLALSQAPSSARFTGNARHHRQPLSDACTVPPSIGYPSGDKLHLQINGKLKKNERMLPSVLHCRPFSLVTCLLNGQL